MSTFQRPRPRPSDITQPYWDAAAAHRLVVQQCRACGSKQFYPRCLCMKCASEDLEWAACSGQGSVYTYTINHRAPHAHFKARLPYVTAMIDLDEGVRMLANIVGDDALRTAIGARVRVVFEDAGDGITLPQFELAGEP